MQLTLFNNPVNALTESKGGILPEELFEAYYSCRKNKRNTYNALSFEVDYEQNLIQLCDEINNHTYQPKRSIAFIVEKPVKREIFAADFRDRVVHHFLINKLNPLFEREFINDSYACRSGKGTHFGINRIYGFIAKCSKNYTEQCYLLKLDVQGFFMHIYKVILYNRLMQFINNKYFGNDIATIKDLCNVFINNDPTKNCIIKGKKNDWNDLPVNKSLFNSPVNCGLPIGNLTSQIFANFYMNSFDHFMKKQLGIKYYGRYVDDFIIIHKDRDYLKSLIPMVRKYLRDNLELTLHPAKIYLQDYKKGVTFLGAVIKPGRVYNSKRTINAFCEAIEKQNKIVRKRKPDQLQQKSFLSTMNSYLGIMKHYRSYSLRKTIIYDNLSAWWWNYTYVNSSALKFIMKQKVIKENRSFHNYTLGRSNSDAYIYKLYCNDAGINNYRE